MLSVQFTVLVSCHVVENQKISFKKSLKSGMLFQALGIWLHLRGIFFLGPTITISIKKCRNKKIKTLEM